jgi:hypothetical protein
MLNFVLSMRSTAMQPAAMGLTAEVTSLTRCCVCCYPVQFSGGAKAALAMVSCGEMCLNL